MRAWWTDYHDGLDDHLLHARVWGPWREGDGRRVLDRGPARIVIEDRMAGRRSTSTVTIAPGGHVAIIVEADEWTAHIDAAFEPAGKGTHLVWVARVEPKGIRGRAWLALNRSDLLDRMRLDLEAHAAAYEADAARASVT